MADEPISETEELQRQLRILKEQYAEIKNLTEQEKEILEIQEKKRENLRAIRDAQKGITELKKTIAELDAAASDEERKQLLELEKQTQILINNTAKLEKQKENIKKASESAKDLANSFSTIFSGKAPELKGALDPKNLMSVAEKMKDIKAGGMAATKVFASKLTIGSLLVYSKAIVDLAIDLADVEANFMKATAANQDFARSVTNSYHETRKFGASMQETSKAYEDLYTGFTDFTFMAKEQRESLAQTNAVLNKLGISNTDFTKSVQNSTKALGMSAEQAGQNMLNMQKFAEEIGVAPQMLGKQFTVAGEMMAKMGDQGVDAFKDLAIASKITGLEMEKILRITNEFDTFEGAAKQAGKLNAALGGNFVNAMDLMMATDPVERFNMIRDSLLNAGLSFDDMSYYQKKFYADSLGLSDVSELALVMSGNMDTLSDSTKQTEQDYVDAAKRAREMATMQEKLNMAFVQMIPIITPLIDAFSKMAGFIADNAKAFKILLGIASIVFGIISGPTGVGGVAGLTLGFSLLFDSVETGGESLTLLGAIFEGFIAPFKVFFGFLSGIYEAVFKPMVDGISELYQESENFRKAIVLFGYILGAIGAAVVASFAGPVGLAIGVVAGLVAVIQKLGDLMFTTPFNPPSFLIGLVEIGDAFLMMAEKAMEILNPFNAVERAIRAIGETFSSILGGVTSFFTAITDPTGAENILKIAKAISEVKTIPAAAFTAAVTATAATATATAAGTPAATSGREQIVRQPIQVTLNGDKMAEFVVEVIGREIRTVRAGG